MSKSAFQLPDDLTYKEIEEGIRELEAIEQERKQVEFHLWKKNYAGYEVISHGGLIFIYNKTKTKREQLKWLKKYSEVLQTHGIDAKIYNDRTVAYICF